MSTYGEKKAAFLLKIAHRCRPDIIKSLSSSPSMSLEGLMMETTSQPGHEVAKEVERMLAEGVLKQTSDGELYLTERGHPNNAKEAAFSEALDKHPALKGKQSQLPDKIQAGIIKKKLRPRSPSARERFIASRITKKAAAKTLGEAALLALGSPRAAGLYNKLRSDTLSKFLQTEIPGTRGVHLPGMNPKKVKALADSLSHPETAVQVAIPGSFLHMPVTEFFKRRLRGLSDIAGKTAAASTESQVLEALSAEGGAAGMAALRKRIKGRDLQRAIKALIAANKVRKHPDGDLIKESAATATKTDPAKWEAAKRDAKARMGGKHSARAMQLATQIYKKKGGGYSGSKPTSKNNSLKKWGKQKWGYSGKDKPGQGGSGVYLPKNKRERLKSTAEGRKRLDSASRKKSEATRKGQQYSSHGLAANTSLKAKK